MSWRDHEYDHGTYLPRGCRRAEDAADRLRTQLNTAEAERDRYREALQLVSDHHVTASAPALDAYSMQDVAREALS